MRNIQKTLFLLLLAFVCSCTSDEQLQEISIVKESTKVTAILTDWNIEDSRTTITTGPYPTAPSPVWVTGDSIGIYPDAGGDQLSFRINEGGSKTCSFDGGGWAMKSSSYTAYSPFKRSFYYEEKDALPISMLGQTQNGNNNADHLGAYDIQIAKGEKPKNGSLIFQFNRHVALARLEITAPKAATWASITLESDALFTTEATMNLALETPTVTPAATSNSITLNLKNVSTTNDGLSIIAYMMLLPVDLTGKTLSVKLTDTDDNVYTSNGTITNNKTIFSANAARWISATFSNQKTDATPYLTFIADAAQTFTMSKSIETIEYSVNDGNWITLGTNAISFGGKYGNLKLRGKSLIGTALSAKDYASFSFKNNVTVSCTGDIRTLVDYENYTMVNMDKVRFCGLFKDCTNLTTAPQLPATTLANSCYSYMFYGCTNLTTAPKLPATTLADYCYDSMFYGCTNLTTAPELPATTLAKSCYTAMFFGCTNLIFAPELPATILSNSCYNNMFWGCTSLTTSPELPATTLKDNCYFRMFYGCTSLKSVTDLPATILADYCYDSMFQGCTSLLTTPKLPAMTLKEQCYTRMFQGCTSLTTAPELPATTLANSCYTAMFSGCSNLAGAPQLSASTLTNSCYSAMFANCTSLATAPELPATTLANSCYSSMFQGCTSLTTAPELPATTLANSCYSSMFQGCTSLTTAPKLMTEKLVESCYSNMFYGCSSLNEVTMIATDISASKCLYYWLDKVSNTGQFTKDALTYLPSGASGIPNGWKVIYFVKD